MKMKPTILAISGYSGAGKDTVAGLLGKDVIKFASPGKRALECILGVPVGFLDDRVSRGQIAPDCQGRTYLEVLIDFWEHRDLAIGSDLFPRRVKRLIEAHLSAGYDCAVTDMRSKEEMQVLAQLNQDGYKVTPLWITGGTELKSDQISYGLFLELTKECGLLEPIVVQNASQNGHADLLKKVINALKTANTP